MNLVVPGPFEPCQVAGKVKGLALRQQTSDHAGRPFEVLDSFDQSLRKSGRFLAEFNGELILFTDSGSLLRQPAARQGNFPADLQDGPVREALRDLSALRSLVVSGSGTATETRFDLVDDHEKTRARVTALVMTPAGAGKVTSLVAMRGLRGYEKALKRLTEAVAAQAGDQPQDVSSLHQRLFPDLPAYEPKPAIRFSDDETAYEAANDIIATHIRVARQNEPGVIADLDTEFLHDYRIALRKIRSVLSLFKGVYSDAATEALKSAFAAHMSATGRLRDLDVYLLERQHYFDLLPESLHSGLNVMFAMFENERAARQRALGRRLKSVSYRRDIEALAKQFSGDDLPQPGVRANRPANTYACELIWKRYRRVCRIAAGIDDDSPDSEVHALRIQCKKLRYLMEFFAPLFPAKEFKPLLKPLKRLQDNLGFFNDYSVQQVSLQEFLAAHSDGDRARLVELAKSVGALIAVLHQRQLEERNRITSSFRQFDAPKNRAAFRRLFKTD